MGLLVAADAQNSDRYLLGNYHAMQVIIGSYIHGQLPFERAAEDENSALAQSVHR